MVATPREQPVRTLGPEGDGNDTLAAGEGDGRSGTVHAAIGRGSAFGRYVVLERLGTGGMGVVYSAFDPELDRKVALKVLRPSTTGDPSDARRSRLLREAQALAKLSHPNVVTIYDVGTFAGDVFIAMEFIAGITLRAFIERAPREGYGWRLVLERFVAAGRGLVAAHRAGIVHRDFKPENVMIDGQGSVKVLDFGLARPARTNDDASGVLEPATGGSGGLGSRLTATGALVGTPYYMAPEQYAQGEIDERTDQFAFCVSLYEALYGERPFPGTTTAELSHAITQGMLRVPTQRNRVPLRVRRALLRGLRTAPADRFPSMESLLDALTRDPFARARRIAWGGLLIATPIIALGVAMATRERGPSCAGTEAPLAESWDPGKREAVRQNLVNHGHAHEVHRVLAALDGYANAWSHARHDACAATHERHEQTLATLELRYACLDARRFRLEAMTAMLGEGDADIRARAVELARGLTPIADCADADTLRRARRLPDDAAMRQRVSELERRLVTLQTWAKGGQFKRARDQLDALVADAEAVGYRRILGEVLAEKGHLQVFVGDNDAAEQTLERALLIGEAEGHDELVFLALIHTARLHGSHRNAFELAWAELRRARAVAERMGDPIDRLAQWSMACARLASSEQNHALSAEYYQSYLDYEQKLGRGDTGATITALSSRAGALAMLDRTDEAEALASLALTRGIAALGETHPEIGGALIQRARIASTHGDNERARVDLERAKEIIAAAYGPEHSNIGAVLHSLAVVHVRSGRFDEARRAFEEALPVLAKTYGEDNAQYAIALEHTGGIYVKLNRPLEGIPFVERALAIRERVFGSSTHVADTQIALAEAQLAADLLELATETYAEAERTFDALPSTKDTELSRGWIAWGLGDIARRSGRRKEARRQFEQAVRFLEPGDPESNRLSRSRLALADLRWQAGERESALELARLALSAIEADPMVVEDSEAARRWLAAHAP